MTGVKGDPRSLAFGGGSALLPTLPGCLFQLPMCRLSSQGLCMGVSHVGWGPAGRDASIFVDRLSAIYARSVPAQKGMCTIPHNTVQLLCGIRMDASQPWVHATV